MFDGCVVLAFRHLRRGWLRGHDGVIRELGERALWSPENDGDCFLYTRAVVRVYLNTPRIQYMTMNHDFGPGTPNIGLVTPRARLVFRAALAAVEVQIRSYGGEGVALSTEHRICPRTVLNIMKRSTFCQSTSSLASALGLQKLYVTTSIRVNEQLMPHFSSNSNIK
jgi:hypothetical protein